MSPIKFRKLSSNAKIPGYQSEQAAGFDFCASEDCRLEKGQVTLIPTGLSCEIPEGFELQVRARSGLAAKAGVFLVNGVGTIDSDYRGEIKVIASTCLDQSVEIKAGDRIAQGVLAPVTRAEISEVAELSDTARGAGGFGSTGKA